MPTTPDFALPLLNRATYATFTRKTGISKQLGRVHPQYKSPDLHHQHPAFFYVEWPADSGDFHEIHAPTLAAISGYESPRGHTYHLSDVTRLLEAMHTLPVPQLLHACRPK